MKKFGNIDDFVTYYVAQNSDAYQFVKQYLRLGIKALTEFRGKYYSRKGSKGAKFSERVFSYWLYKEVEHLDPLVRTQDDLTLTLPLEREVKIKKPIDLSLVYQQIKTVIEFKTNIDMVEKDLYKFYLCQRFYQDVEPLKKILFVWEAQNKFYTKDGLESQYASLLKLAVQDRVIDAYIYLPIETPINEVFLNAELKKLSHTLLQVHEQ